MASRSCALKGCGNSVSVNSPYTYCYQHRSMSGSSAPMIAEDLAETNPELFESASLTTTPTQAYSDALVDALPIHGSYSMKIAQACGNWRRKVRVDGTIPTEAARIDANGAATKLLREELIRSGISPERITLWEFSGGSRRDPITNEEQSLGSEKHQALVMDKGTIREVVIDASVSKYAPVSDWQAPVDDQLPSGMTPYSDSPWIGTMSEYTRGGFLKWSNATQIG